MATQTIEQYEAPARDYCMMIGLLPDMLVVEPTKDMSYRLTLQWRVIAAEMIKVHAMMHCLQKHQGLQTEAQ